LGSARVLLVRCGRRMSWMHPSGLFPSVLATVRVTKRHLQADEVRRSGIERQQRSEPTRIPCALAGACSLLALGR
jgi:hypothetical protein